jgi:pimeloyl-ACP methyl ester carboxylesterase
MMLVVPVEIQISERLVLRGERYGETGERWAILVHEEGRDLDGWRSLVPALVELGLTGLAVDLPGHGASTGTWEPASLPRQLAGVFDYARSPGAGSLYVLGAGAGATAAVAAAGGRDVKAIVALSPLAELAGVSPEALRETSAPKLILAGGGDPARAEEAAELYRRAIGWGVLQTPPVPEQGTSLLESEWAEHVVEATIGFLRDYL